MTRHRGAIVVAAIVVAVVGVLLYGAVDPSTHLFPRCPLRALTGYNCPGCGSQRAIHSLLNGDIHAAAHYNAMLLVALPYLVLLGIGSLLQRRYPRLLTALTSPIACYSIAAVIIAWWIGRNLLLPIDL